MQALVASLHLGSSQSLIAVQSLFVAQGAPSGVGPSHVRETSTGASTAESAPSPASVS
jgi:hypothetical protein